MKAYVASGWFSPEQEESRLDIINALTEAGIEMYSPKDDNMHKDGVTNPKEVYFENLQNIENADFIVASTEGKDMGTIFECGLAAGWDIPIVYYWKGGTGAFNLMLSQSGIAVHTDFNSLLDHLVGIKIQKEVYEIPYTGENE